MRVRIRVRIRIRIRIRDICYRYTGIYGHKYTCVYIRKSIWQYFNLGCTDIDIDSDSEHQQRNETKRKSKNKERKPKAAAKPNKVCYTFLPLAINYALTALRTSTCMYVCMYVCMYECMGVWVWVCVWVCVNVLLHCSGLTAGYVYGLCLYGCELCIMSAFQLGFTIHWFPSGGSTHTHRQNHVSVWPCTWEISHGLIILNSQDNPGGVNLLYTLNAK